MTPGTPPEGIVSGGAGHVVGQFGLHVPLRPEDFEACIAHLACPPSVRKVIRTANLLERLFEEERRRTKTIHSFFGERPVLKLMYASVIRASDTWRGIRIGELERGQLERLREQLIDKHREATKAAKNTNPGSAPSPFYSKDPT